jgi:uncharacterized membrane protein
VVLAAATVAGLVALWPSGKARPDPQGILAVGDTFAASVLTTDVGTCANTAPDAGVSCRVVTVRLSEGPDAGRSFEIEFPDVPTSPDLGAGDQVVLARQPNAPESLRYALIDVERRPALLWLALIFGVLVVALGRLRGVTALVSLAGTVAIVVAFVLPAILDGRSPVLVAVVGASAIAFVALYVSHGFTVRTTVALLGTLSGLAVTALLSTAFVELAGLTGLAAEEGGVITALGISVDLEGLILAGVVIGAMGAIDDVAITQVSSIWEVHDADPSLDPRRLYRAGIRVGRDHVGSIVNTLVLAYAGASLPLFVIFAVSRQSLSQIVNGELVATEIIRTLAGSIGLIASVPITTWLASHIAPMAEPGEDELPEPAG